MANLLGDFIASEVLRAEADFASGRARALSIVGLTAGVVGLVSGLLTIAAGSNKDILPKPAFVVLAISLVGFIVAVILALVVNLPASIIAADATELGKLVQSDWDDEGWDKSVADMNVAYLASLRSANSRSATLLNWSIGAEIVGVAGISIMALLVVYRLLG